MLSKEVAERKRVNRYLTGWKKMNFWELLLGEYQDTCCSNILVLTALAFNVSGFFVILFGAGLAVGIPVGCLFGSLQVILCVAKKKEIWSHRDYEDSDWYSAEEAEVFLNSLEDQKHIYTQRIIVKRRRAGSNPDETILDESENVEYEDWLNLSSKLDLGGKKMQGVTKMYVASIAEVGDTITHETFQQKKQKFITPREGRGDYYEYSTKLHHPQTPDFILISEKTTDGTPNIPCYYSQKLRNCCTCLHVGAFWDAFVEACLLTTVVFYNQKAISVGKIEDDLKQSIENIKEQNKCQL